MMQQRRLILVTALVTAGSLSTGAGALEAGAPLGEPLKVDVTHTSTLAHHVDNRNDRRADVSRFADDHWGLWQNRLNAQASWSSWTAALRLDAAWFYASPTSTSMALDLLAAEHGGTLPDTYDDEDARYFVQSLRQADAELSNRYIDWIYPSKYSVGYTTRAIEATVGDFYAQLGRGLVLSVRKLDELASDTTVRGARITGRVRVLGAKVELTGLGGVMNPLRLDAGSGRYLSVSDPSGISTIAEAGMPRPVTSTLLGESTPTYSPDRIVGAQILGGPRVFKLGVQGSLLDRTLADTDRDGRSHDALSPGAIRSAHRIPTGSVSAQTPDLGGHGSAYVEAAVQGHDYVSELEAADAARPEGERILPGAGHAIYASASALARPVVLTLEGRHYRRFFPLLGNVDIGAAREFSGVQYSAPPTTEPIWVDTELEGFNTCVTGGRLKGDVEVRRDHTAFLWLGHHRTWAESVTNERCRTDDSNLNRVWDLAAGVEILSQGRHSRAEATVGTRFDDADRLLLDPASGQETHVFYREVYARYDITRWLGGPWSLELQGWHRRRRQTLGGPGEVFFQGHHITSLHLAARTSVGVGFEYDTSPQFPSTYVNGQATYRISSASNVTLSGGQRRGGLRCLSGVCRVLPPFEGAQVEVTVRF